MAEARLLNDSVGKYKVLSRLGKGGMGEVFRAVQIDLEREVALKVLSEDVSAKRASDRFLREAKLQAKFEHPNLVRLFDAGSAGKRLYYAMELVDGQTLSERMGKGGRSHPAFVARVGRQMASAFGYYHPMGLVHRDIKPSNIMLAKDEDETLKLMDFGIAHEAGAERLTRTKAVVGTARYLSPEMARGEEPTGASDVYQLGLVLYEMVCGVTPHSAPHQPVAVAMARRAAGERAPDPRAVWPACPARLAEVINACLAPNPAERIAPAALEEELSALELKLKGWLAPSGPVPPWNPAESPSRPLGAKNPLSGPQTQALAEATPGASGPYPPAASQPMPPVGGQGGKMVLATLGLSVVAIGAVFGILGRDRAYRAESVVVQPGARGVVVTWTSPSRYETRIRFGAEGGDPGRWATAQADGDGHEHRLALEGLEPGARYGFQVLFPDGTASLPRAFQAPKPFAIQHLKLQVTGEDSVEWRFTTPVEVKANLEVVTADGVTVRLDETESSMEHRLRFRFDQLVRPVRSVKARFLAADGPLEPAFPTDGPLTLVQHLEAVLGPRARSWDDFLNRTDEIRTKNEGFALPRWQAELSTLVKGELEGKGVIEAWAQLAPLVSEFLRSDAPWAQRKGLLEAMSYLSLLDRVYDLYSLPPFFQVMGRLAGVLSFQSTPPIEVPPGREFVAEVPYNANMLVPVNYSQKARDQINSFAGMVYPDKGGVGTEIELELDLPVAAQGEAALGIEARGLYPFLGLMVRIEARPDAAGDPGGPAIFFFAPREGVDLPIANEFSMIEFARGKKMDTIFPVQTLWARIPAECLPQGKVPLRIRLLSLQHHSIFPMVVRKVMARIP